MSGGRLDEAEREFELAVRDIDRILSSEESNPVSPELRLQLATLLNNLSKISIDANCNNHLDKAFGLNEKAIETLQQHQPRSHASNHALALCLNNRASIQMKWNQPKQAIASYRESIQFQRAMLEDASMVVRYSEDLVITYNELGRVLHGESRDDDARAAIESAKKLMRSLVNRLPQQQRYQTALAGIEQNLRRIQP